MPLGCAGRTRTPSSALTGQRFHPPPRPRSLPWDADPSGSTSPALSLSGGSGPNRTGSLRPSRPQPGAGPGGAGSPQPTRPRVRGLQGPFVTSAKPLPTLPHHRPERSLSSPRRSLGPGAPGPRTPVQQEAHHTHTPYTPGPASRPRRTPLKGPERSPQPRKPRSRPPPQKAPHLPVVRSLPSSRSPATAAATPHLSPPDNAEAGGGHL